MPYKLTVFQLTVVKPFLQALVTKEIEDNSNALVTKATTTKCKETVKKLSIKDSIAKELV